MDAVPTPVPPPDGWIPWPYTYADVEIEPEEPFREPFESGPCWVLIYSYRVQWHDKAEGKHTAVQDGL